MIAAVYRWFLGQLEGIAGEGALVYVGVIALLSVIAGYAIYELGALLWRLWIEYRIRRHVKQVWPIPFVEPEHSDPWPLRVTLVFVALVLAIMLNCGFKGV